jgi:hypothetical protein
VKTKKQGASIFYRISNPKINQVCDMVREGLMDQLMKKQDLSNNYSSEIA